MNLHSSIHGALFTHEVFNEEFIKREHLIDAHAYLSGEEPNTLRQKTYIHIVNTKVVCDEQITMAES